ncbi:hypothetical protein ACTFIT_001027 [Dictyostelium discoideum]
MITQPYSSTKRDEKKKTQTISRALQYVSKQWNSPLNKSKLPPHLNQLITTINTLFG